MMKLLSSAVTTRILAGILACSALLPFSTQALTVVDAAVPLNWKDISAQVTPAKNHPVWAMAYAKPYWYFTDGQELYTGGHVWRTDGTWVKDITTEVRSKGLNRVDDMISDGTSVIFLKNIVNRRNNFEMLRYTPETNTYTYPSYAISSILNWDEGIASLKGSNGSWAFVTTNGRVFTWNFQTNTGTQIRSHSAYASAIRYSVRKSSPADEFTMLPVAIAPISGGWLISSLENGQVRFYTHKNGTTTDITNSLGYFRSIHAFGSNGTTALIAGSTTDFGSTDRVYSTDGYSAYDVTNAAISVYSALNWRKATIVGDASAMIILSEKTKVAYSPTSRAFQLYAGQGKNFVLTADSDRNGHYLVGGVFADPVHSQPLFPLMPKLEYVTFSPNATTQTIPTTPSGFGGGRTTTSVQGPTIVTTGSLANYQITNGQTFTFRAEAWDSNTVDRIDLYVNNVRIKTCYSSICEFSSPYYLNGESLRNVIFYARATDKPGYSTDSTVETLTIGSGTYVPTQTGNYPTSYTTNLSPYQTTLRQNQGTTFSVNASDANYIKQIDLFANGSVIKTCLPTYGNMNSVCDTAIYGSGYTVGSTVNLNASIRDWQDTVTWINPTSLQILTVEPTYPTPTQNQNGWISLTVNPTATTLTHGQFATLSATATDGNGIQTMRLYVNGIAVLTCEGYQATSRTCTTNVQAADYPAYQDLFLNAVAIDVLGNQTWSEGKTLRINPVTNTTGSTTGPQGNISIVANKSSYRAGETITFTASATQPTTIDILVNAVLVKTCTNATSCVYLGGPYDAQNTVDYAARMSDGLYGLWTGYKTISKQ